MRLQMPTVVFSGAASLRVGSATNDLASARETGYMQSCVPSTMNLLESFANDPSLGGVAPRLSAQRVSKVAPLTKPKDELRRINGRESLRLNICPVLHTRVRFSRPNTAPPSPSMIAVLEVDFTPFFDCEAALDKVSLEVTDGVVEDLNTQDGMRLPLSCVAHDHLTFLYKLAPQKRDVAPKNMTRELTITLEVVVLVRPENEPNPCTPRLIMTWPTPVDFTPPVNPGFGQASCPSAAECTRSRWFPPPLFTPTRSLLSKQPRPQRPPLLSLISASPLPSPARQGPWLSARNSPGPSSSLTGAKQET
jgi:hypothetical protein